MPNITMRLPTSSTHLYPKIFTASAIALLALPCLAPCDLSAQNKPNIVVMLADDMGYGELQCLNPRRGKIKTPQLDAIAAGGMIFTDAHTGSAVCTPTRYGLMTGRYCWRTRLQNGVLTGGKSLIARERLTMAKMLKEQGYHAAMFGKWHLGMLYNGKADGSPRVPIGAVVSDGPIDAGGFDEFAGFHHARQMNVWVENQKVTEHIEEVEMLPKLTAAAVSYINGRKDKQQPFFLYVPWNSPHSPVVPSPEWQGKSGLNAHGDFVMQTDDSYGRIVKALRENGLLENTLIICSSDNGTSPRVSGIDQLEKMGHFPSGDLRGAKSALWDGGHRVPFLVHWPAVIKPGSTCDQLVCMTDVMATCADILGISLPESAAEDSVSFLPALKGEPIVSSRAGVIHHSISGHFSYRMGKWKLLLSKGSGGWSSPTEKQVKAGSPEGQLYDMEADLGEQNNLYESYPEVVARLLKQLENDVARGRSTGTGSAQNDTKEIVLWKNRRQKKDKDSALP